MLTDDDVHRLGLADWALEPVDYPFGTPTTEGAVRVHRGTETRFVKIVRSFRHWPLIGTLPPDIREMALSSPIWRYEADVYTSGAGAVLPDGMRLPDVYAVVDMHDDRVAVVMENVEATRKPWDPARFARAARLLGRANARLTRQDVLPASASRIPGYMTALHYTSRLQIAELPALADDRTWAHPLLAPQTRLRADLARLAPHLPAMVERLGRLPQAMIHGDFSPQNLLVPADDPETFVVIDWSMGGLAAVGDDLGQLLIGLAHAGQLRPGELPGLHDIILDAYAEGLADEDFPAGVDDVRTGFDGGVLLRSTFTALPLERLREPLTDELATLIEERIALTAYLCGLGLETVSSPSP